MDEVVQTPIQNPVIQPPKTNWLLISLIGLLILAAGVGIGLVVGKYLYSPIPSPIPIVSTSPTPSSNPTANWKTFNNEEKGIGFKYPGDLYAVVPKSDGGIVTIWKAAKLLEPEPEYYFSLYESKDTVDSAIQKLLKAGTFKDDYKIEDIEVAGQKAKKISGTVADGPIAGNFLQLAFFEKDRVVYIFEDSGILKQPELFNQILSTFKFTQPVSEKDAALSAFTGYLNALTKDDCPLVKSFLTQSAKAEFGDVECNNSYTRWEGLDEFHSAQEEVSFYSQAKITFAAKLYKLNDSVGTKISVRFEKENGSWKTDAFFMKE